MSELLHRQVHPEQLKLDGGPTSGVVIPSRAAFTPSAAHGYMLSTRRNSAVSARDAYETSGIESAGTWSIAVSDASGLSLPCLDDSAIGGNPPGHASIDFNGLASRKARERAGASLRAAAVLRGPTYCPGGAP